MRKLSYLLNLLVLVCASSMLSAGDFTIAPEPSAPVAKARVVIAEDVNSIAAFNPRPDKVEDLINRGLLAFTGKATREDAWRSLVTAKDTVGIKVVSAPGANSGTRPSVVEALV